MTNASNSLSSRLLFPALLLLVLLVWAPVGSFEFLKLDDNLNVYENRLVLHFSAANLAQIWRAPLESLYIPITYSLWAILAKLGALWAGPGQPPNPHLFHSANLLLHLLNTALLFRLLKGLSKSPWGAAGGALLFALHPVQVEPVAWVTGLKDLLSGTFYLTALNLYCQTASDQEGRRWPSPLPTYLGATVAFLAAMLAKPGAIVLPLVAGILGWGMLAKKPRQVLLELTPWFLLCLPVVVMTTRAQPDGGQPNLTALWERLLLGGDTILFYLGKLLLPLKLGPDYGRTPTVALAHKWILLTGTLPYLLAGILAWRGGRWARLAGGLFLATLLPVLGFLSFNFQHISTVADRYLYLALLAPAFGLAMLTARYGDRRPFQIGVAVLLALCTVGTTLQLRHWRNPETLATQALKVNPQSWLAYNDLGLALLDRGQPAEAIRAWRQTIALNPNFISAYINLANGLSAQQQPAAAIQALRQALTIDPSSAKAAFNLGVIYQELGQHREAIGAFRKALASRPDFAEAYSNLGIDYEGLGQLREAEVAYRQAIALQADFAEGYNNLGRLLAGSGRPAEAIPLLRQATRLRPEQPMPYNNLGIAEAEGGNQGAAIAAWQEAIKADPNFAQGYNNLALAYGRQGQYREAIRYYDQARALGLIDPSQEKLLQPYR